MGWSVEEKEKSKATKKMRQRNGKEREMQKMLVSVERRKCTFMNVLQQKPSLCNIMR